MCDAATEKCEDIVLSMTAGLSKQMLGTSAGAWLLLLVLDLAQTAVSPRGEAFVAEML
jgi:hypothetical protein